MWIGPCHRCAAWSLTADDEKPSSPPHMPPIGKHRRFQEGNTSWPQFVSSSSLKPIPSAPESLARRIEAGWQYLSNVTDRLPKRNAQLFIRVRGCQNWSKNLIFLGAKNSWSVSGEPYISSHAERVAGLVQMNDTNLGVTIPVEHRSYRLLEFGTDTHSNNQTHLQRLGGKAALQNSISLTKLPQCRFSSLESTLYNSFVTVKATAPVCFSFPPTEFPRYRRGYRQEIFFLKIPLGFFPIGNQVMEPTDDTGDRRSILKSQFTRGQPSMRKSCVCRFFHYHLSGAFVLCLLI